MPRAGAPPRSLAFCHPTPPGHRGEAPFQKPNTAPSPRAPGSCPAPFSCPPLFTFPSHCCVNPPKTLPCPSSISINNSIWEIWLIFFDFSQPKNHIFLRKFHIVQKPSRNLLTFASKLSILKATQGRKTASRFFRTGNPVRSVLSGRGTFPG